MKQPIFRFKGYTDDWEQRRLDDISADYKNSIVDGPFGSDLKNADYTEDGVLVMQSNYITSGIFDIKQPYFVSKEKANQLSRCHCKGGDILIAKIGANFGICNIIPKNIKDAVLSSNCMKVDLDEEHDNEFYMQYFNILYESGYYYSLVGITAQPALSLKFMKSLEVPSTSTDEQIKIASFLKTVDNIITLNQRKCDALKELKKGMLQKMFPKDGEKVPEFRFKGFTGDWEQRKFCDVAETRRGLTYKPTDVNGDGVRVLRSSNINEDVFEVHEDDVFVNKEVVNIPYTKNGDILITSANGSNRLVGKHAIVGGIQERSTVHGGFMLIASSDEPEFVNASMSSTWYTNFINVFVAGGNGAIGNLSKKDLDEQDIFVPCKEERDIIGLLFNKLDKLIALQQRKCDALKEIKKGFLQKMFI